MNPVPDLDPVPLAAPVAIFRLLLLLTFTLHLIPMSAVLGGSIIGAVARWQGSRGRAHQAELARLIGKLLPVTIAAAVTLGVAALLFLQVLYGRVFFSSSVVMAWFWIAVVPLVIVAYYAAYGVAFAKLPGGRAGLSYVGVALFLAIAFIYTNNMSLMLRPEAQHALFAQSAAGSRLNASDATVIPRYLHMVSGAIGIAGLLVAVLGLGRRRLAPEFGLWAAAYGCRWFVLATVVNILAGMWFLAALPRAISGLLIGGDPDATFILALGIVGAISAIGLALQVATTMTPGRYLAGAFACASITVVMMVLTRDTVRNATLGAVGFQPASWVAPQWGPIAIFAVLLVAAIALVTWMVTALVRANPTRADARKDRTQALGV